MAFNKVLVYGHSSTTAATITIIVVINTRHSTASVYPPTTNQQDFNSLSLRRTGKRPRFTPKQVVHSSTSQEELRQLTASPERGVFFNSVPKLTHLPFRK
ncbi:hypothetical protein quinque_011770 [Culex quinquefasciatus]